MRDLAHVDVTGRSHRAPEAAAAACHPHRMRPPRTLALAIAALLAPCSRSGDAPPPRWPRPGPPPSGPAPPWAGCPGPGAPPPPARSAGRPAAAPPARDKPQHRSSGKHEDRHDPAAAPKLQLTVAIHGATAS